MTRTTRTYRDDAARPNDGRRYEIHDGEPSVTPAPTPQHQIVSARLLLVLHRWIENHPGGLMLHAPLDMVLSDTPARHRPDRGSGRDRYVLATGAAGPDAVDLQPFTGLGLVPGSRWP